ncbi:MAG: hypothetical protein FD175_2613 [Beijerinckiaceae bacterium]|nr:MAG: hypothetical protein FD175_2613 [Beijerinckiaceae bacterium]
MAERKQFLTNMTVDPELAELVRVSRRKPVTQEELHEQRVSFAFGNALEDESVTKDSVRQTSLSARLSLV